MGDNKGVVSGNTSSLNIPRPKAKRNLRGRNLLIGPREMADDISVPPDLSDAIPVNHDCIGKPGMRQF